MSCHLVVELSGGVIAGLGEPVQPRRTFEPCLFGHSLNQGAAKALASVCRADEQVLQVADVFAPATGVIEVVHDANELSVQAGTEGMQPIPSL